MKHEIRISANCQQATPRIELRLPDYWGERHYHALEHVIAPLNGTIEPARHRAFVPARTALGVHTILGEFFKHQEYKFVNANGRPIIEDLLVEALLSQEEIYNIKHEPKGR